MIRRVTIPVSTLLYWGNVAAMLAAFAGFIAFAACKGALDESLRWFEQHALP